MIATIVPMAAVGGSAVHLAHGVSPMPTPDAVSPGELGANGALPQNDAISPDLLGAANDPGKLAEQVGPLANVPKGPLGIPGVVLDAYLRAQQRMAGMNPHCHLDWSLLAGIGKVESNQARSGMVDARGTTLSPILGPTLDGGPGNAAVADTDGGRYDGDPTWDRAVGPMQFIPSTWAMDAADGNGDGIADPNNVYDAALAAGKYLCAGGGDLSQPADRAEAVFRYNHSNDYVRLVLLWADAYAAGITPLSTQAVLPVSYPQPIAGPAALPPAAGPGAPPAAPPPGAPGADPVGPGPSGTGGTSVPGGAPPPAGSPTGGSGPTTPPPSSTPPSSAPPSSTPPSSAPPSSTPPSSTPPPTCPTTTTTTTTSPTPPPSSTTAPPPSCTPPPSSSSPTPPPSSPRAT
jgi:hypothetical protein